MWSAVANLNECTLLSNIHKIAVEMKLLATKLSLRGLNAYQGASFKSYQFSKGREIFSSAHLSQNVVKIINTFQCYSQKL